MIVPSLPIYELKNVTHKFSNSPCLVDINLQIKMGDRVALVGASGAGKSTLISLLNGTIQPTQGEIWAFGRNLNKLSTSKKRLIQRQIGTIYQQFNLVENLKVIHNVNAGHLGYWSFFKAALSLIYPLEIEAATQALTKVGIPEKIYQRTDQLSGGQQQRVAIARILVQNPTIILADEPIASLDPERSQEIMDLLRNLSEKMNKTLVTSLHDIDFAQSHYERIIGLKAGGILFDTQTKELTKSDIKELYHQVNS